MLFRSTGFVDETFHRRSSAATERNIHSYRVQAQWSPVTDLVLATGSAVVLVVAANRVVDRHLSVGTMLVVLAPPDKSWTAPGDAQRQLREFGNARCPPKWTIGRRSAFNCYETGACHPSQQANCLLSSPF